MKGDYELMGNADIEYAEDFVRADVFPELLIVVVGEIFNVVEALLSDDFTDTLDVFAVVPVGAFVDAVFVVFLDVFAVLLARPALFPLFLSTVSLNSRSATLGRAALPLVRAS